MPSFTTDDTVRTSPVKADSVPFTGIFAGSGVLPLTGDEMALKAKESPAITFPNKSVSIHLSNGGIIRESRPLIPDEEDDKREARA